MGVLFCWVFLRRGRRETRLNLEKDEREFRKRTRLSISLQETWFLCNNPNHDQPAREAGGGRHLFLPLQGGTAGSYRSGNWTRRRKWLSRSRRARPGGRGGGACQPTLSVIFASMTVAPAAGTSPEPQGAGSRGLSLTPATATLECPGPNGPPPRAPSHSSTASPLSPKNENFLPAYPVPSEADSCHPGNDPSERPSRSPRIPSALLKLLSTTPSNTPEHLSPSGTHPWIPGPEAVARGGGGRPHP